MDRFTPFGDLSSLQVSSAAELTRGPKSAAERAAQAGLVCSAASARELMQESAASADLLRIAIERSGLSARQFAAQVLIRDERTIRRWLSGENPIPSVVIDKLKTLLGG